jgi:hypothetical protein
VGGGADAGVTTTAKSEVAGLREEADGGEVLADELGGAVGGSVIDDEDFVEGARGGDDGGEVLFEEVAAVPIRDNDGGARGVGCLIGLEALGAGEQEEGVKCVEGETGEEEEWGRQEE